MSRTVFRSPGGAREVHACYRQVLDGWPVRKSELRLPTCQGETFVLAYGPEDAPAVVLLHGAQANAAVWLPDALGWSQGLRCYAVDVIGEAGCSAPARPPLNSPAHALWLDDVLRGLGLSRASFVGVSMGGWLALDYARRRPQAVERLALLCPAGIGRQKNFLLKAAPLLLLGPWGARRLRELVFGPPPKEVSPAVQPLAALLRAIGRHIRPRLVQFPRLTDTELRALTMPLLAIVGGRDVLFDSGQTRQRLQALVPHAEVVFLPEARHALFGQSDRVLQFLAPAGGPTRCA